MEKRNLCGVEVRLVFRVAKFEGCPIAVTAEEVAQADMENDERKRKAMKRKRKAVKMAIKDWVLLSFLLVYATGAVGTMFVPVIMGMTAIFAYLFYLLEMK